MASNKEPTGHNFWSSLVNLFRTKSLLIILIFFSLVFLMTTVQFMFPQTIRYVFKNSTFLRNLSQNTTSFTPSSLDNNNTHVINDGTISHLLGKKLKESKETEMFRNYSSQFKMPVVNCANIFKGVKHAIDLGVQLAKDHLKSVPLLSNEYYNNLTTNCQKFIRTRGYITSYLTVEEREFPIAYSIIVYKELEMVDRLLRSIYRPQNWYCIHADQKSSQEFVLALTKLIQCFPNVFLSSKRINVHWGTFSVLEPELVCMKDLHAKGSWKYFINLTGQEMPLKTNYELVKILTAYNGANDVEGTVKRANKERWKGIAPPKGLRPTKGSVHIVVSRPFVDYILHNETSTALLKWVNKTEIPDETFFTMLNHNSQLGIPGTYAGWPETDTSTRKPFLARFKNWGNYPFKFPCAGYWTRGICILSTGDLPLLGSRMELFANKFHLLQDRIAVGCLEEKHFNDTRDEYFGVKHFNTSYYESLGFVLNQVGIESTSGA